MSFRMLTSALLLIASSFIPAMAAEAPLPVHEVRHLSTDNWYPLSETQLKRAVADAALSVLTSESRLRIMAPDHAAEGRITFDISLIGPARTAKATLTLDSAATGSVVSTASVSLDGMDHQGIFNALEHLGEEAARRMAASLRVMDSRSKTASTDEMNTELQKAFEEASRLKRAGDFSAARKQFLEVMQHEDESSGNWPALAADEIRYGLPMYEAKHLLSGGGRFSVNPDDLLANLGQAENLLRQVLAENAGVAERVQESQRLLDQIQLTRTAYRRSMQANSIARMSPLRMMLAEEVMMSGECPDAESLADMSSYLPEGIGIEVRDGDAKRRRYEVTDERSELVVSMQCDTSRIAEQPITLSVD